MSKDRATNPYPDSNKIYLQKEHKRRLNAAQSVSKKLELVNKLRQVEQSLASVRKANKAKRATKQIKISIKTR